MKKIPVALALFSLTLVACRSLAPGSGIADQNRATAVQVDNQGFLDMTVYAARSAQRLRLGIAPGNAITVLSVPPGIVGGLTPLRFIADPIGGQRPSVSEEITVAPGDTVVMTIPPI
jgi:hypothetical protein